MWVRVARLKMKEKRKRKCLRTVQLNDEDVFESLNLQGTGAGQTRVGVKR